MPVATRHNIGAPQPKHNEPRQSRSGVATGTPSPTARALQRADRTFASHWPIDKRTSFGPSGRRWPRDSESSQRSSRTNRQRTSSRSLPETCSWRGRDLGGATTGRSAVLGAACGARRRNRSPSARRDRPIRACGSAGPASHNRTTSARSRDSVNARAQTPFGVGSACGPVPARPQSRHPGLRGLRL